ncbi:hypothetical protein [Clostridium sp.]|uniref:hypothetical protein n=1 Tax=Clostridium sp. TaxID=1506 RepID=UPI0025C5D624|nr:hypothetical protein [Clostridium sp.]
MRVTKVIKDYIEREINKKYQEKLNSIPNDYQEDYNKMIEEIRQYAEKCNEKAKDIARKYDMLEKEDYNIIEYRTYYLGNIKRQQKRRDIERELKKEKDDKIAQTILDLELGEVNKKELNDVLNNISF